MNSSEDLFCGTTFRDIIKGIQYTANVFGVVMGMNALFYILFKSQMVTEYYLHILYLGIFFRDIRDKVIENGNSKGHEIQKIIVDKNDQDPWPALNWSHKRLNQATMVFKTLIFSLFVSILGQQLINVLPLRDYVGLLHSH